MSTNTIPAGPAQLLTLGDIMRILQVKRSKAYLVIRELPQVNIGRGVRIRRETFEAWLREHEEEPCAGFGRRT